MFARSLAVLAVLFAAAGVASAQCRTYYSTPVHYQTQYVDRIVEKVVIQKEYVPIPVAVPFQAIIPVSGYIYGGATPAVVGAYPPPAQSYPQPQAQAPAPAASDCTAQIAELKRYLDQRLSERDGDELPRAKRVRSVGSLHDRAMTILRTDCASCHTGSKSKGGMVMFSDDGAWNPSADKVKIFKAADTGRMPPDAQKDVELALPDDKVDVLKEWSGQR